MHTILEALLFFVVVATPALAATNFWTGRREPNAEGGRPTGRDFHPAPSR